MSHESDSRRRQLLSVAIDLGVRADLYVARVAGRSQRAARDHCLRAAIDHLICAGVSRLTIESCDQDKHDRQVIQSVVAGRVSGSDFQYVHERPAVEPLLWLPDMVAWAFGKGGDWRRRAEAVVGEVVTLEP